MTSVAAGNFLGRYRVILDAVGLTFFSFSLSIVAVSQWYSLAAVVVLASALVGQCGRDRTHFWH